MGLDSQSPPQLKTKTRMRYVISISALRKGNVFTSVCQEFCPLGGAVCMATGVHGRGVCMAEGCVWQGGVGSRRYGHCSGQYASYWNAFLFLGYVFILKRNFSF